LEVDGLPGRFAFEEGTHEAELVARRAFEVENADLPGRFFRLVLAGRGAGCSESREEGQEQTAAVQHEGVPLLGEGRWCGPSRCEGYFPPWNEGSASPPAAPPSPTPPAPAPPSRRAALGVPDPAGASPRTAPAPPPRPSARLQGPPPAPPEIEDRG